MRPCGFARSPTLRCLRGVDTRTPTLPAPPPATREKCALRQAMLQRRRTQPPTQATALGVCAQRALLASPAWREAGCVALYVAVRGELPTRLLLDDAWARGVTVLLPRCKADAPGLMDFVVCHGPQELAPGAHGIAEPLPSLPVADMPRLPPGPGLVLVPGVAFDKQGARLGMGGGYYDRILERLPTSWRCVGLCFGWQVLERLPRDPWDKPVDALCTEQGLAWI